MECRSCKFGGKSLCRGDQHDSIPAKKLKNNGHLDVLDLEYLERARTFEGSTRTLIQVLGLIKEELIIFIRAPREARIAFISHFYFLKAFCVRVNFEM